MTTKQELESAVIDLETESDTLVGKVELLMNRLDTHRERMRQTIEELRAGMNQQHAANRLEKMGRELYGKGWK